jgi:hypothetical protein
MQNQSYKAPGFIAIIAGVILFVILVGLVCSLSTTVKVLGYGLLYLPSRLGWVEVPGPKSIHRLDLVTTPQDVYFDQAGSYLAFTSNYDLLSISMELEKSPTVSWFRVADASTGYPAQVEFVTRGLMPYDTPFAQGRPVVRFTIDKPGQYELQFPTPPGASLDIVPDTTTGKEWLIWLIYLGEVGVVFGIPGWFSVRSWRRGANEMAGLRQAQRARADRFWKRDSAQKDVDGQGESYQKW